MTGEPAGTEGGPAGSPDRRAPPALTSPYEFVPSQQVVSLCDPFVRMLPITGVSIFALGAHGDQPTTCSSDEVASKIDELPFELGEGPHRTALKTARPVLVDDVRRDSGAEWPVVTIESNGFEVGAVFAIPMVMGAVVVGLVDLYRASPGWLRPRDLYRAMVMAGSVTSAAVQNAISEADREASVHSDGAPAIRREVHQATGMTSVPVELTPTDASRRLKAEHSPAAAPFMTLLETS